LLSLYAMRTIIISEDPELLALLNRSEISEDHQITVLRESKDPLDVMSAVCEANPSLVIVDDDFLQPETVHLLKSLRKINKKMNIIFCTSNTTVDLGKEVSQLGIQYYAVKPLDEGELLASFKAALEAYNRKISSFS
jgi:DNA-binding response OmpR family regulator